jgi:hypothetical protein
MPKATLLHIQPGKLKEKLTLLTLPGKKKNVNQQVLQNSTFTTCFKFRTIVTIREMQADCKREVLPFCTFAHSSLHYVNAHTAYVMLCPSVCLQFRFKILY